MIECWLGYKCYRNSEGKILRLMKGGLSGGWGKWSNIYLEVEGEEPDGGKNISCTPSLLLIVKVIKSRNLMGRDSA